ncbi:hypothetical protein CJ030_MR6G027711 [Morella rubra]|uniref:Uncharacterized protein n=1 Tax=Morella rubra TaxID=262757 RepID=A0A6A1V981_9ROSI|nr:hypothetical protein CJ030_MR6G027711 [Morella rubra]
MASEDGRTIVGRGSESDRRRADNRLMMVGEGVGRPERGCRKFPGGMLNGAPEGPREDVGSSPEECQTGAPEDSREDAGSAPEECRKGAGKPNKRTKEELSHRIEMAPIPC